MELRIRKEKLVYALNNVSHAVSQKSSMAILEGIYLSAKDGKLQLRGSDLDLFIETTIETEVITEGEIVVNSNILLEMIKRMPDDTLHLISSEGMLIVRCKKIEVNVVCMNGNDFPKLPNLVKNAKITIPQKLIKDMVKSTSFAVAMDEARPILQGILLEIKNNKLSLVALDGYRMAIRTESVEVNADTDISAVVMGKNFLEVSKLLENKEDVTVCFTENQILFEVGETKIVSRLLEGNFVEYNSLLPQDNNINIKVNKESFASAIERASLVGKADKSNIIKLEMIDDRIIVTSNSSLGKVKEEVVADIKGDNIKMAFNPRYMLDVLKNIDGEDITMEVKSSLTPCLITNEKAKYLVLPVRVAG